MLRCADVQGSLAAGVSEASITLDDGLSTEALCHTLAEQYPGLQRLLPRCGLAHNGEYVHGTVSLSDGDEVALIPPVSGG